MKNLCALFLMLFFYQNSPFLQNEWMLFNGSNLVRDVEMHDGKIWVISGSGLSEIDPLTGERVTLNRINSELPTHDFVKLAIGNDGRAWLAGSMVAVVDDGEVQSWSIGDPTDPFSGGAFNVATMSNGDGLVSLSLDGTRKLMRYGNSSVTEIMPPSNADYIFNGSGLAVTSDDVIWTIVQNISSSETSMASYDGVDWTVHDLSGLIPNFSIQCYFVADNSGNLFLQDVGLENIVLRYDGSNWENLEAPSPFSTFNSRWELTVDGQGHLWIPRYDDQLFEYDGSEWIIHDLTSFGFSGGDAYGFERDDSGGWWLHYNSDPLNNADLYHIEGGDVSVVDLSNSGLPSNSMFLEIDAAQNIWAEAYPDLTRFDGTDWGNVNMPPSMEGYNPGGGDLNANLWFFDYGENPVYHYDGTSFNPFYFYDPDSILYNGVRDIDVLPNGTVYACFGPYEVVKLANGEVSWMDVPNSISHLDAIAEDNIWAAGYWGFYRFNGVAWDIIEPWDDVFFDGVDAILADKENNLYVEPTGSSFPFGSKEFMVYNGSDWNEFESPYTLYSYPAWDSENNLWIGVKEGLVKYDGEDWTLFPFEEIPLPARDIRQIVIDKYDNLWITVSQFGLLAFNENGINNIGPLNLFEADLRSKIELSISPNPTTDIVTVSISEENHEEFNLRLIDPSGRILISQGIKGDTPVQLSLTELPTSIYSIVIENEKFKGSAQIIKQ